MLHTLIEKRIVYCKKLLRTFFCEFYDQTLNSKVNKFVLPQSRSQSPTLGRLRLCNTKHYQWVPRYEVTLVLDIYLSLLGGGTVWFADKMALQVRRSGSELGRYR